ncbi:TonB-dependent receptor [Salinimicrobium catena]|uniref:TonB-dependent receptor plug domain-containing protein n=1 Tax=Salinimicrobium catena TaxID=390640 RepID=UPI002FE49466
MKSKKIYILVLFLLYVLQGLGQKDSVNVLEEVVIDAKLKDFSTGQTIITIPDSLKRGTRPLLTSLLNYNSPIYFKENGLGMVSSPSFRGTAASHTAVLWNGINVNSQLNGQTDFNTINAGAYDQISIRGGGGSVVYGTGAIGGTVHLNTRLSFKEKLENELYVGYGSYNSLDARYSVKAARGNWSVSLSGAHNSSDNDYLYPNDRGENMNGQFYNNTFNLGVAYRMDPTNIFRLYSGIFSGERHLSLVRPSETRTKYQDAHMRYLLEWENKMSAFTSLLKMAYLKEKYEYYSDIASDNSLFGDAENFILKYDLTYSVSEKMQFSTVLSNTNTKGKGSNLGENSRNIFSVVMLMKHRPTEKFSYESGIRKEVTGNYESPILFSSSGIYRFSDLYRLKVNASRNFRIPTYNDLYWTSAGRPGLKPETSWQGEIGNEFKWRQLELNLTGYYIAIKDMIRWLPESGGVWRPRNEDEVHTYGTEAYLQWEKGLGETQVALRGSYSFTISENQQTGKQLIYVPFHKATFMGQGNFKSWEIEYQLLYNGEVFTRSDNNSRYNLNSYMVSNIGASYTFGKNDNYQLGGRVQNVFNTAYESVENRWMPGRNFNINLTFTF